MSYKKRLFITTIILILLFSMSVSAYQQISNGSKGTDVTTMQKMLNVVINSNLKEDGICGPKSVTAIKNFQKAYGLKEDGICGPKTWEKLEAAYNEIINNTISSEEFLSYELTNNSITITNCDESVNGEIIIPSIIDGYTVTAIGERAFRDCKNITSVTIPDTVTSIECEAFFRCENLISVSLPNSLKTIGDYAFCSCYKLNSISIPSSVTSIGAYAFCYCYDLTNISVPNGVNVINDYLFFCCTNLKYLTMSNNITQIGACGFAHCNSLTDIVIPDGVTHIGELAFYDCINVLSITIPDSVIKIDSRALGYYKTNDAVLMKNFVLKGSSDSTAETYANTNGITFESTSRTCDNHEYTSSTGGVCSLCGYVFEVKLTYVGKIMEVKRNNTPARKQPYSVQGEIVKRFSKGEKIEVAYSLVNAVGNTWYLTYDNCYIYSNNLTEATLKNCNISFKSNGDKISNLPGNVCVKEYSTYKIPSRAAEIPQRDGYKFLGYGTTKNATAPTYYVGQTIKVTSDMTFYPVWKEFSAALNEVPGIAQNQYQTSGTCTTAATAVILARRLVVDEKNEIFDFLDVRKSCFVASGYKNSTFGLYKMSNKHTGNGNTTYSLKKETLSNIRGNAQEITKYIVKLLDEHPEGIVFYYNYGKNNTGHHAIVLSDYEILPNGKYQFYAYDSASSDYLGRMKLEEIYSWKNKLKLNSYEDLFLKANDGHKYFKAGKNYGYCVWYINKEVK